LKNPHNILLILNTLLQKQVFLPSTLFREEEHITFSHHGIRGWETPDLIYGEFSQEIFHDLEEEVAQAYEKVTQFLLKHGKTHLWRCWHRLPRINEFERGRERYQLFCSGRYRSLIRQSFVSEKNLPAASAVGTNEEIFTIAFLASNQAGRSINNSNQIRPYRYPKEYGIHAPSFSRAYLAKGILFISGTASIAGHESLHHDSLLMQLEETTRRLKELLQAHQPRHLTAYVRHREDFDTVENFIEKHFAKLESYQLLEADICRQELLIEIEMIAE